MLAAVVLSSLLPAISAGDRASAQEAAAPVPVQTNDAPATVPEAAPAVPAAVPQVQPEAATTTQEPAAAVQPDPAAAAQSTTAPAALPTDAAAAEGAAAEAAGASGDAAPAALGDAAPAAHGIDAGHLPRDLSPWNMFLSADIVVKAVMIGLAFASVVTWTVWLAKSIELTWAKRKLSRAYSEIHASSSLAEAAQRLSGKPGVVAGLIDVAAVELRLSADVSDKAGIKERVLSRLDGLTSAAGRDMNRGTGVLATIGSTSPFVGLFGTVWGIMNSFIGISEAQTTNLAIVAPGIAEALLATAIGLVAAIPAVIIYNQFARSIGGYRAMVAEASAEVMRLVSRDLDRGYKVVAARAAE